MKNLNSVHFYFWKYRWRFLAGIFFIIISNYFGVLAPQITGFIVDKVQHQIALLHHSGSEKAPGKVVFDPLVHFVIDIIERSTLSYGTIIILCGLILLFLALLRGFFMFLMRQTIIVMSRHIEFDQKNAIYEHYQKLDLRFFKMHSTGDLMSRMTEDVSRVRMYTGPAIMYFVNLIALISLSLFYMFRKDFTLSLYVLSPLPILAFLIYSVNTIINKKSEFIQAKLSDLTTNAQESYSGIRVIKSFVQEKSMQGFFNTNSEAYMKSAISLAKVEALYFPVIALIMGFSTLMTIYIGGRYQVDHLISGGTIAEFVVYINMLTFPVIAVGWVASMIQRASASQKRINEFLASEPAIKEPPEKFDTTGKSGLIFQDVTFTYPDTGITALQDFSLNVSAGTKVAIIGRTGSGKSTLAQLILRMYDVDSGSIFLGGTDIRSLSLKKLRREISYVPQDTFLFSDTIAGNIGFGDRGIPFSDIQNAAIAASVDSDIQTFSEGYDTPVGERGVTLSGGQKQRISIARAISRNSPIILFDDCLSAVDSRTEKQILGNLTKELTGRTALIITHRIFTLLQFDKIIVMEDGKIVEEGNHEDLMSLDGFYREMYEKQRSGETLLND